MAWCLVYWTPSLWVPGSMPGRKFIFPFFSFLTCVNRVIITIPSPGGLRIPMIIIIVESSISGWNIGIPWHPPPSGLWICSLLKLYFVCMCIHLYICLCVCVTMCLCLTVYQSRDEGGTAFKCQVWNLVNRAGVKTLDESC